MKTILVTVGLLIICIIISLYILGIISQSRKIQGLVSGKLSKCPNKPNCICSEEKGDTKHYIEPIILPQNTAFDVLSLSKNVVIKMGGIIQIEKRYYFAATFSSFIFGFVDDLEIRFDSIKNVIHIRSAARVGHTDMGTNKIRVELFKKLFKNQMTTKMNNTLD